MILKDLAVFLVLGGLLLFFVMAVRGVPEPFFAFPMLLVLAGLGILATQTDPVFTAID